MKKPTPQTNQTSLVLRVLLLVSWHCCFTNLNWNLFIPLIRKRAKKLLKMESSKLFKYTFIPFDCLCFSLFFFPQSSTSVGIPTSGLNRNTSLGASSPKWQTLNASNSQKKYVIHYCGRCFQSRSYKIITTKTSAIRKWKLIFAIIIFLQEKPEFFTTWCLMQIDENEKPLNFVWYETCVSALTVNEDFIKKIFFRM